MWLAGVARASVVLLPASAWTPTITPVSGMIKRSVGGLGEAAGFSEAAHPSPVAGCHLALHELSAGRRCPAESGLTLSIKQGANVVVVMVVGLKDAGREGSAEAALARLALTRL